MPLHDAEAMWYHSAPFLEVKTTTESLLCLNYVYYRVSQKSSSTFDKILKNKDNVNKLMER